MTCLGALFVVGSPFIAAASWVGLMVIAAGCAVLVVKVSRWFGEQIVGD